MKNKETLLSLISLILLILLFIFLSRDTSENYYDYDNTEVIYSVEDDYKKNGFLLDKDFNGDPNFLIDYKFDGDPNFLINP